MTRYIALIHKESSSDFGVSFPDFPGCVTAGRTLDEARDLAAEALAFHIEGLLEDGVVLPEPSSLDSVMTERENQDAVAIVVDAPVPRTVRVNVTMPKDVLEKLDAAARARGMSRSGFLVHAVRHELEP